MNQKMADLPPYRTQPYEPPFTSVGIDCFGPFLVKRARSEVKRYGCIFCCLVTRAVHIEMLDSLDTSSFLNAFRRFSSRRGWPKRVVSDNGTNFVCGQKEMFRLKEAEIHQFSLAKGVEWIFQPPHASHMCGAWERLIRTIRKVLVGTIPRNIVLTDESLRTVLCEIEHVVNSRPITKVSDDPADGAALTPNHVLLLNCSPVLSPTLTSDADVFRHRWRCIQHLANIFWTKWLKEYLPDLQMRHKWQRDKRNVQVGDVVLVVQENTPRGIWPLGLVIAVNEGADGHVRSCRLRLKNDSEISRPINKCVLLECTN